MTVILPQILLDEEMAFLTLEKGLPIGKNQIGISAFKYILRILQLFQNFAQIIYPLF